MAHCIAWCPQLRNPGTSDREPPKAFTFDQVYDWGSRQDTIFDITAKPIVDACMDGYNGACWGQQQAKTHDSCGMQLHVGSVQMMVRSQQQLTHMRGERW